MDTCSSTTGKVEVDTSASAIPWNSSLRPKAGHEQGGEQEGSADADAGTVSRWEIFSLLVIAFVLLTLTTFSLPFIPKLYFLWSSQRGGVRFGIWGWCQEEGKVCSERLGMGYTWEPEVSIPITKALALYPVVAISVLMSIISMVFVMCNTKSRKALRVMKFLVWSSCGLAVVVFLFMIAMWSVADERFKAAGWKVHWGPLPWMSFVAAFLLIIVSVKCCCGVASTDWKWSSKIAGVDSEEGRELDSIHELLEADKISNFYQNLKDQCTVQGENVELEASVMKERQRYSRTTLDLERNLDYDYGKEEWGSLDQSSRGDSDARSVASDITTTPPRVLLVGRGSKRSRFSRT